MSFLYQPKPYSEGAKRQAVIQLLEQTVPDRDFYCLVVGAIVLAASGILIDSVPVLIASMIVAPLGYPILALSLAIIARDSKLMLRSLGMIGISVVLALLIGGCFSLFAKAHLAVAERVFISFFPNIFFDLFIAVVSGMIAAYGLMRSKVGAAMTGIGIAVSLMPPLVATGIGLFDPVDSLALHAGSIFLFNVGGIMVGSMLIFLAFGLGREYHQVLKK